MKRFKAVIFDLGGVLVKGKKIEFTQGVHKMVAKKLHVDLDPYFDSIDLVYADATRGKISKRKALKSMARNLNTTPKKLEKVYSEVYRTNFAPDPTMCDFALGLKKRGYKIAIISDIWPVAKEILLKKDHFRQFNSVVASCDVGSMKIEDKIFKIALKKLKVDPKEAIFTDNLEDNLSAPKKLGLTTILYKNNKQFFRELKKHGIEV